MINQFLAQLDNNPVAPANWVWPTFTARTLDPTAQAWWNALVGTGLAREHQFLRCLALDELVRSSSLVAERTALDPRISYRQSDAMARLSGYGYQVTYAGQEGTPAVLAPTLSTQAVEYTQATLLITSATQAVVQFATGANQQVTYSGAGSTYGVFPLAPDGSITGVLQGHQPLSGSTWQFTYWSPQAAPVLRALRVAAQLGRPAWLPPDLLATWDALSTPMDRLACAVAGLAR